jgi:uncharacterized protein
MSDDISIVVDEKIPKNSIIFEGFQGIGLVGTLAAQYIADKTKAKLIGYINSALLPPMALLVNGELKHPMKVYHFKNGKQNFIIFESELPMPQKLVTRIAEKIAQFAQDNKIKEIMCFEGLATKEPPITSTVFGVISQKGTNKKFDKIVKILQNGIIIGVSAALLMEAKVYKIPAYCLIAEAHADFPDGLAAAALIKKVNQLYDLNVDVTELEKESQRFEENIWKVIEKAHQLKQTDDDTAPKKTYIG